jgi:superfamily II DNA/RNA helicase
VAKAIHGDISQSLRELTLRSLKDKTTNCLIATDVAARGLDIPSVDLVIHASPPQDVESYIHRSGRTGRAGRIGTAVCLYTSSDTSVMYEIEREVGIKFARLAVPSAESNLNVPKLISSLSEVSDAVLPKFEAGAKQLTEKLGPMKAVQILLAKLSGHISPVRNRSLLNGSESHTTIKLVGKHPFRAQSDAIQAIQTITNSFGEVAICKGLLSF